MANNLFGKEMRKEFVMDEGNICVNQASFGKIPKRVFQAKVRYQNEFHLNPELFWSQLDEKLIHERRQLLGEFVNANPEQLFLCQTTSEALNSIVQGIKLEKGDKCLLHSFSYIAARQIIKHFSQKDGFDVLHVVLERKELTPEAIVRKYEDVLSTNQIKVAIFDFVPCYPSVKWPVKALVDLCRKYGTISVVDAAHSIGITKVDITALNPDFYYCNLHKWMYVPAPCSLLWMQEKYKEVLHTAIINMYYQGGLQKEFSFPGLYDNSPRYAIKEALEFIAEIGFDNIMEYSHRMAYEGGRILAKIFGTEMFTEDKEQLIGLNQIRFPVNDANFAKQIQHEFLCERKIFLKFDFMFDNVWLRVTGNIYNELSDYEKLGEMIMEYIAKSNQAKETGIDETLTQ